MNKWCIVIYWATRRDLDTFKRPGFNITIFLKFNLKFISTAKLLLFKQGLPPPPINARLRLIFLGITPLKINFPEDVSEMLVLLVPSCIILICGKCLIVRSKQIWDKEASHSGPGLAASVRSDQTLPHSPARPPGNNTVNMDTINFADMTLPCRSVFCEKELNLNCMRVSVYSPLVGGFSGERVLVI